MKLDTPHLCIESVADLTWRDPLLPVFNSNPEYVAAEEQDPGKTSYSPADVERYLMDETSREGSRCLVIRDRVGSRLVGTACLLVPHPTDRLPWIGLLLIHGEEQGRGLGAEALHAVEHALAGEGWTALRIGVLLTNPRARRFWNREGYQVIEEASDTVGRPCWIMQKPLAATGPLEGTCDG